MKKILYLLNYTGKGGTEKYVLDLIRSVGIAHCIFIYSEEGPGLDDFKKLNVKMYQVKMSGPFDLKAALSIKEIIQTEKVEVVHAQFLRENYLAILAKLFGANCKVIWTYHVDVRMNQVIKTLNKFMTRFNHKVITVSKFMYEMLLKKGVASSKLTLIYNGVDMPTETTPLTKLRDIPVISVIGRLREEKGQEFLLKSLSFLKQTNPDLNWVCHIYGEGPQKSELMLLTKKMQIENYVQFKGFTSDKQKIYLNSDIIVIPSSNEALSYVAIEALSYQRVVVSTNVGGLPEVIKNDETGLLVEYGDVEGMAKQLKRLFSDQDLVQKLSMNGKKFFDSQFTLSKMREQTLAHYSD